jgi:Xaa-Pro aminopeptidase
MKTIIKGNDMKGMPQILAVRQQAEVIRAILHKRLDTILPEAMRQANLDMWIILCQEDDYDPVFKTMVPLDTWAPILQMLIFYDRGPGKSVERINLSMTDTGDLYDRPWKGVHHEEQWTQLRGMIEERHPERIGINIGRVNWATGGLTYNLYRQLVEAVPAIAGNLVSAEKACEHWLMTLTVDELEIFNHVARIAHEMIAECFHPRAITPGITTTDDLAWAYWQRSVNLGLELAFKPFFRLIRSDAAKVIYPVEDKVIRRGDLLHCDVGIRYLRLNSDHQELAYVLRDGETKAPEGFTRLLAEGNRLQKAFMDEFKLGLTGNELLAKILSSAQRQGIPNPRIYSHSLGLYLHEPGPLIGLPWEQEINPGRGDVALGHNTCFTMELAVEDAIAEWDDQIVRLSLEQDVKFTERGCEPVDGVQTSFHLI